jgi:hypothetical protein
VIARLSGMLRPSAEAVVELARRETDPAYSRAFEPLHLGPVVSFALLLAIGAAGAILAPYRIFANLIGLRR